MKKVLVLVADYPDNMGKVKLMYVHTRNLYYVRNQIDVTVLNFASHIDEYTLDDIRVISLNQYKKENNNYDILILHAANLRNHYVFLKKYGKRFERFIFFYHGHEVMKINKDYCKQYDFVKKKHIHNILQNVYDSVKLFIWRIYLPKVLFKSNFVFVSRWMLDIFLKNVRINPLKIESKISITYNNVGLDFETSFYNELSEKKYDFITIRSNLDNAKYGVDIVNQLAYNTPNAKFVLIGQGEFFNHFKKAPNLEWINCTMNHQEIIKYLNLSKYGLMPTRTDAQGLMMCEMAAFGIPVITSDIPVCHEIFDGFNNSFYIRNDKAISLDNYLKLKIVPEKDTRFFIQNTVKKEIEIINITK